MKINKIALFALLLLCTLVSSSSIYAQKGGTPKSWGLGLRLGDPSGITLKKYFGGTKALEFSVGRTSFWNNSYDRYDYFDNWYDKRYKNGKFWNDTWFRDVTFNAYSFQAHYLIHKDIKGVSGLRWYVGFGPQIRILQYKYYYWDDFFDRTMETKTFVNLGVDGKGGVEYTFADAPFSVFADVNIYLELFNSPFFIMGQGGIGGRYNF